MGFLPEEAEDEDLVLEKLVSALGLELADEGLAAAVHVHGGDEGEESVGVAADGGVLLGRPLDTTRPLVAVAAGLVGLLLASEAGGQQDGGGSQLEDAEDGEGGAEGAGGGGQEGDGEGTVVGDGREGAEAMDASHEGGVEKEGQEGLGVHCVLLKKDRNRYRYRKHYERRKSMYILGWKSHTQLNPVFAFELSSWP